MKKYFLLSVVFIIAFIMGLLVQKYLQANKDISFHKTVLKIVNDNNTMIANDVRAYLSQMKEYGIDTNNKEFRIITQADSIVHYFEDILLSKEKINTFSLSKIKSILENNRTINLDDFYSIANSIDLSNKTPEDAMLFISICYNIILDRCLAAYHQSSLMVGGLEGVFFIPTKDAVNLGDTFQAKVCFSVKDLTLQHKLKFDNDSLNEIPLQDKLVFSNDDTTIFKGNVYKETATKKGLNNRKGYLIYLNGRDDIFFPFEFSYNVK